MLKRLYLANGTLQAPLSTKAEDISVDAGLAAYLLAQILVGDWAYLTIEYNGYVEVVKVYADYSGLSVTRAQDGTCRQAFPAGANVVYALTQAEIQDATPAAPITLYANGADPLTVNGSDPQWVVNYPLIVPQYEGGIKAYFTANDGVLHLEDWYPAAGCLDIAGNGAPLIGGPYFYLTSQPYAIETIDWMAPNPNRNKLGQNTNFGFGNLYLLTQPSVSDAYLASKIAVDYMYVFGSSGSFTVVDGNIRSKGIEILQMNTFGSAGAFTVTDSSMLKSGCYILQGLLYGSEVSYTYGHDSYIQSKIAINNMTVS